MLHNYATNSSLWFYIEFKMTAKEIRQSFLDFFKSKNHKIVPSSPVVPQGDPTLLFTNAGMNQFKDVFLEIGERDYKRAADTQKCIRVSGKHNDLEEVGVDTYHHTFFEMLGNWSFGDYYKEEAIAWAWELLTDVWRLPKERLYATVYTTDDEAYEIWKKYLPESRIQRFAEKDNFWEMGETGPCGPCSEIHFDRTPDLSGAKLVNAGSPDVIEIWNLVFIQYNRLSSGELEPLRAKHVDTGMGFERIVSVIQNKNSNYDTDVFSPIINKISNLCEKQYPNDLNHPDGIAMRVIADHIRTLSFAIADGAFPGNEGRGYVLRRILRRGCRYARNLGFMEPILYKLVDTVIDTLGDTFPELIANKEVIQKIIFGEEESFLATLDRGLAKFEDIISKSDTQQNKTIKGEDAFLLYDTFGFPLDLTQLIARERNFAVDQIGFDKQMQEQKNRSRKNRKETSIEIHIPSTEFHTEFTGYNELSSEGKVLWVEDNKIILDRTPFYVESGGQVSDTGEIVIAGTKYKIADVVKSGNARIHISEETFEPSLGVIALASVDKIKRRKIMKNHSATHLVHQALFNVLGSHIKQAGSLVNEEYLRFDFNHFEKLSKEQIKLIEEIVNQKIIEEIEVQITEMKLDEAAKNPKIKMFFGDKYGDIVRVVTMDKNYSSELCGGTHVRNTGDIGFFKITSESAIAAGVRRIEAITAPALQFYIENLQYLVNQKISEKDELIEKLKSLEKQLEKVKIQELQNSVDDLIKNSRDYKGIKVLTMKLDNVSIDELRAVGDEIRNKLAKNSIGLISTVVEDKVQMCCVVTDDLKNLYPAGKVVGRAAQFLGGGGGGKPHLATAGGKEVSKLQELLDNFEKIALE